MWVDDIVGGIFSTFLAINLPFRFVLLISIYVFIDVVYCIYRQGIGRIDMRLAYDKEFPRFPYYHSRNAAEVYRYLNSDVSAGDVVGLRSDQVTKSYVSSFPYVYFVILKLIKQH